ncbi:MAG: DUF2309 domain-containing protein [Pirellulales bacterium]
MHTASPSTVDRADPSLGADTEGMRERLSHAIEHAAHLLPAQGPITVFIHHNTLHAFEQLPFDEAARQAAQVFGCQPYLSEERYRRELSSGRIRFRELQEELRDDLGDRAPESILDLCSRFELRLAMLQYPLLTGRTEELVWYVAEQQALQRVRREASSVVRDRLIAETRRWVMRELRGGNEDAERASVKRRAPASLAELIDRYGEHSMETWSEPEWERFTVQALWRVCCDGVRNLPPYSHPPPRPVRHRDLLFEATGADPDLPVHDLLIRFCAAFLDQGLAAWELPGREHGFYRAFCELYRQPAGPPDRWRRGLDRELNRLVEQQIDPLTSIVESLQVLGVSEDEWTPYLNATFLALRGWGGMIRQIEMRGDRVVQPAPAGSLVEFLAIRLLLDRFSLQYSAEALDYRGSLADLREHVERLLPAVWPPSVEQRAFQVFQLAQILGLAPDALHRLSSEQWAAMVKEIEAFSGIERRRMFHRAYERRLHERALEAVAIHVKGGARRPETPRFQAFFCIDEREESLRRHLEEIAPDAETFGAAGFFSVAIYYRGAADAHFTPLCPVVIRPQQWVSEEVDDGLGETHRRRARTRKALGKATHQFHRGSRSLAVGALLTGSVGVLASAPLVARILFPRLAAEIRQIFNRFLQAPPRTRLQLERSEATAAPENGHIGLSLDEMAAVAERLLRDTGLTRNFAPLVLLHGHGSNSQNNPHNSAYMCGACGGAAGGPNARAAAQILNDDRVRDRLAAKGVLIPRDTRFVGGYHNTCNDVVTYFDVESLPPAKRQEFELARVAMQEACERNAHERCRRFMSAPLTMSFRQAHEHVKERAEDLGQTRPECGHATNALTIVGRRSRSRGLFLDRRAFLVSYDATQDNEIGATLTGILQAILPVCAGISLEYYFSYVDNPGFGCGTKLPHNVSALLGVMDGAASDLRTGLPWQMVEIHEPTRHLFMLESTPEIVLGILDRHENIGRLFRNEWCALAVLHAETGESWWFRQGEFVRFTPPASPLPKAAASVEWYRGWRDHLEFAEIDA